MSSRPLVAIVDDDESLRDATSNLLQAAVSRPPRSPTRKLPPVRRPARRRLPGDRHAHARHERRAAPQHLVALGAPIPTVLITAYASDVTRLRAREAGILCCLAKPFAPDELLGACARRSRATPKS